MKRSQQRGSRPLAASRHTLMIIGTLLLVMTATPALSEGDVDLTLAGSFQFGGSFELFDPEFGYVDLEVEDSSGAAVFLGIPVTRALQVELLAMQQDTEIAIDEGPFNRDFVIGDLELSYYHAGVAWHLPLGQIQPYFAVSAGVSRFQFDIPGVQDETYPSISVGGGLKARFTDHFGLRLDGRLFVTDLDDDFYDYDDRCRRRCDDGESMAQGAISAGLLFTF